MTHTTMRASRAWRARRAWFVAASLAAGAALAAGSADAMIPPDEDYPIFYDQPAAEDSDPVEFAPGAPDALLRRFMQLHTSMKYKEAAEAAMRLADMLPDDPYVHYNLACVLARLHRTDASLDALERAVEQGWRDLGHTQLDPDLQSIRYDSRYEQIIATLKQHLHRERIVPRPLRDEPWEEIVAELEETAPHLLAQHRVPGVAMALVRDGKLVWSGGYGRSVAGDDEDATVMTADHMFKVASPVHLFAAMGVLHVQAEGGTPVETLVSFLMEDDTNTRQGLPPSAQPASLTTRTRAAGVRNSNRSRTFVRGDETLDVFRLAVDMHDEHSFAGYCHDELFMPAEMRRTGTSRRLVAAEPRALGHTRFGTPIPVEAARRVEGIHTTAGDLGRLIAFVQAAHGQDEALIDLLTLCRDELGLAVGAERLQHGLRVQCADESLGMGCLLRWYPDHGCGVAVLYNGAGGRDLARRLAYTALGGE